MAITTEQPTSKKILKRRPPRVGVKHITGLCSVREIGSKGNWDVVLYVELSPKCSVPGSSTWFPVRSYGFDFGNIADREMARQQRDRVVTAMNSGQPIFVCVGEKKVKDPGLDRGTRMEPISEKLYAARDFGWQPKVPSKFRVRAKRITN